MSALLASFVQNKEKKMRDWAASENLEISPELHVEGYEFRTVIPFDDVLYDPLLANWVEEDGSLIICDVGGQAEPGWDPIRGHGALWRLRPDDRLESVIAPGKMHRGCGFYPRLIPDSFGPWGGQALIVAQIAPGRDGAKWDHMLHKWDRRSAVLEPFAILPRSQSVVGEGRPGAPGVGDFGPAGTEYAGAFFMPTFRNNTVYKVTPDGRSEVYAVFDGEKDKMLLPRVLCFGDSNNFPGHEGELLVGGIPNWHYSASGEDGAKKITDVKHEFYRIDKNGKLTGPPVGIGDRMLGRPIKAPAGFGPLSGRLLYSGHGKTNQSQVHIDEGPLPHDGTIYYRNEQGEIVPFLSKLRGGYNDFIFRGDHLIIAHFGKSYSTGEYHDPDGAIWEVSFKP